VRGRAIAEFTEPQGSAREPEQSDRPHEEEARRPASTSASRKLVLPLDEFGQTSLGSQARALGAPPPGIVRQAALHFLAGRGRGRIARKVPQFARDHGRAAAIELTLELEEADWLALEDEAERQEVSLEQLLVHATLLLLADLDSGRVAISILDEDQDEREPEDAP
jgi:hypothetical protein